MLVFATLIGLRIRRGLTDVAFRRQALGVGVAAAGACLTLVTGFSFDIMSKSGAIGDLLYQQAHFSFFYVGFALILYGIGTTMSKSATHWKSLPILWAPYLLCVVVSASFLLNPGTHTTTNPGGSQHFAQQLVFFLPLFLTSLMGISATSITALRSREPALRRASTWFGLFAALMLLGVMREAEVIPSSGDPLADLLVAFVPLTVAGLCLCGSAMSLKKLKQSIGTSSDLQSWGLPTTIH